ncbi:hypothetical protein PR048_014075 [Dryococelus australis]|uniref:Uncharacterized protein n=1 Tax=Dryococelus australis TaxID=614101 RepID=A0ABQ9HUF2_9NEOP|nr:hypothetical protein PR048_014075 [Dryococelus australis]
MSRTLPGVCALSPPLSQRLVYKDWRLRRHRTERESLVSVTFGSKTKGQFLLRMFLFSRQSFTSPADLLFQRNYQDMPSVLTAVGGLSISMGCHWLVHNLKHPSDDRTPRSLDIHMPSIPGLDGCWQVMHNVHRMPNKHHHYVSTDLSLDGALIKIMETEDLPQKNFISVEDQQCEQHFQDTHMRDSESRLWLAATDVTLGDSYSSTLSDCMDWSNECRSPELLSTIQAVHG